MNKNPIWNNHNGNFLLEKEAFILAKIYKIYSIKKNIKVFYKLNEIKKSKWWNHFLKTVELYANEEKWNAEEFIKSQFEAKDKIFPFELIRKESWKIFLDYLNNKPKNSTEISIAKDLLNSYNMIKNWCYKNKKEFSVEDYINNPINENLLKRNNGPSLYFLSISKSFRKFYENLNNEDKNKIGMIEIFDLKRSIIYSYKKIWNKMKEILNEEMY